MPKIIVYIPVKNDAWFVREAICHAVVWADHVIVADENSFDGSIEIYKELESKFDNLNVIYNRPKFNFTTAEPRNYMLEAVRNFDGCNIIFEMHADEIMSAEILDSDIKNRLRDELKIGSALMLPWLTLWKDPLLYRVDNSVWGNNKCWFAFRDDRNAEFVSPYFHGPRAPDSFLKNRVDADYLRVLHYQFVNISMERSKQALYQVFERNHYPDKNIEYINKIYACAFDERNIVLKKLDDAYIKPWLELGIAIDKTYQINQYNWRDTEVLKNFEKYGVEKYKSLNIWYINWDVKRCLGKELGIDGISEQQICDPRSIGDKMAHSFLMKTQLYPFWRFDFFRLLFQKFTEKIKRFSKWQK